MLCSSWLVLSRDWSAALTPGCDTGLGRTTAGGGELPEPRNLLLLLLSIDDVGLVSPEGWSPGPEGGTSTPPDDDVKSDDVRLARDFVNGDVGDVADFGEYDEVGMEKGGDLEEAEVGEVEEEGAGAEKGKGL
nr:hypothetical protein BaRGS_022046 [Batillaria attramentaria]